MTLHYVNDPVTGMSGLRPFKGSARKITVHTTETSVKPNWQQQRTGLPHYTLAENTAYSHIPLDMAAYTMAGGANSPNSDAGVHIQIEWVGYSQDTPTRSDLDYSALSELIDDISKKIGCPWVFPFRFVGSQEGLSGAVRQSWESYAPASGIMGHVHAPYTTTRWDPGILDTERLMFLRPPEPDVVDYDRIAEMVDAQIEDEELLNVLLRVERKVDDLSRKLGNLRLVVDN